MSDNEKIKIIEDNINSIMEIIQITKNPVRGKLHYHKYLSVLCLNTFITEETINTSSTHTNSETSYEGKRTNKILNSQVVY